jgi:C-terminal processing protease CtpA/Prc
LGTISGERVAHRIVRFIQEQRTYWALARPVGEDLVDLMVEDPNGEKHSYVIDLMSLADYDALWSPPIQPQGETLIFYQENKIATLDYRRYLNGTQGRQTLDDVFRALQARKTTHLILDLRCDGRDRQQAVTTLLSYLLDRPSLVYAQTDTKISPEIIARGRQQDYRKREGEVITTVFDPQPQEVRNARFSGTLFVLIGPETYGAAADLAAVLKDYERGTLVGAETGGLREHYGYAQAFTLEHSGITFEVSTTKCYPPLPRVDDDQRGTVPDVEFTPSMLAPYLQETDPTLSFVLETVTKRLAPKP